MAAFIWLVVLMLVTTDEKVPIGLHPLLVKVEPSKEEGDHVEEDTKDPHRGEDAKRAHGGNCS